MAFAEHWVQRFPAAAEPDDWISRHFIEPLAEMSVHPAPDQMNPPQAEFLSRLNAAAPGPVASGEVELTLMIGSLWSGRFNGFNSSSDGVQGRHVKATSKGSAHILLDFFAGAYRRSQPRRYCR
jgi:hypothetical protein